MEATAGVLLFLLGVYETVVWIQAFFSRESGSRTGIDWQLFDTWGRTWQSRAYMVENVIMFLPLEFCCRWQKGGVPNGGRCF